MSLHKSPCDRNCPDRKPTCHAYCEKYLAYAEECEKVRRIRLDNSLTYSASPSKARFCKGKIMRRKKK